MVILFSSHLVCRYQYPIFEWSMKYYTEVEETERREGEGGRGRGTERGDTKLETNSTGVVTKARLKAPNDPMAPSTSLLPLSLIGISVPNEKLIKKEIE